MPKNAGVDKAKDLQATYGKYFKYLGENESQSKANGAFKRFSIHKQVRLTYTARTLGK